ncbi:MAG: hypothetical protein U5J64_05255 [Halobacteriales archaeon]|nr:hypothetical protein [Halobacteriales archaeon]
MILTAIEYLSTLLRSYAWAILPVLLIFEFVIVFALNPKYHLEIVEVESNVNEQSDVFQTHALTLSGMAFTVVAILVALTDEPSRFVDTLSVLATAIFFLFFSYEVREVTQTKKYWFTLQEKTLGYGFLSLFIGVVLLYDTAILDRRAWLLIAGFAIVAGIRFLTIKRQMEMFYNMKKNEISEQE